ncbi:Fic family protein [Actinophytocola sp. KF-1]
MSDFRPGVSGHWVPVGGIEKLPSRMVQEGAFRPAPLHDDLELSMSTYQAVADAQGELGRLDEAAARLPNREALVRVTQLREAGASLDLDGLFVSLAEVMAMDLPHVDIPAAIDPRVLRFRRADDDAVARIAGGASLAGTLLVRTAHMLAGGPSRESDERAELMARVPWRTGHAWLGGRFAEDANLLCVPPGPEMQAAVAEFATWLEADTDLPLVVHLALAHLQFVLLSPVSYSDHLGRLMIPLACIRANILRDQILAPSLCFSYANEEYRQQLRNFVDRGNFDAWVVFFANELRELCKSQIELVYALEEIRDELLNKLNRRNDGLARLVDSLISTPVFNTELAMKLSGLGERQVRTLIATLERADLVRTLDKNRWPRKKNQQVVREVPAVVKAIGMLDHLPFRRDRTALDK